MIKTGIFTPKILLCICLLFNVCIIVAQPKQEKICLNGTLKEPVTLKIGDQTVTITTLPYEFILQQEQIPVTITITSPNYEYTDITIPKYTKAQYREAKWTGEAIDRTYMIHGEKRQGGVVYQQQVAPVTQQVAPPAKNVKVSSVDNAPLVTTTKNENTFALIIANEDYQMVSPVAMANHDGETFKKYCTATLGIPEEQVKFYPNATFGNMRRALSDIKDIAEAFNGDINLIVYYAGHGIPDNATKDAYIMPVDADGMDMASCFSLKDIYAQINALKLNSAVFFLDACFSGTQRGGDMIVAARGVALAPKKEKPQGNMIVFSAASDQEAAYPYESEGHGLFTYYLLKKLQETKGEVTLGELATYIQQNVSRKAIVVNGKKQTPSVSAADGIKETWQKMKLVPNK